MKIRTATRADVPAILDIYNDAVLTTTATYDYEPRSLQHRIQWFDDHERIGFPIFVAEDDQGKIVGWSSLSRFHDRKGYQFTCENSIYVAAHARGRGVGKLLLEPLIESARNLYCLHETHLMQRGWGSGGSKVLHLIIRPKIYSSNVSARAPNARRS